ncbi:MAG: hypothetical protein ACP5IM_01755 [Candidatus Bathyarchaeia archaeon]
MNQADWERGQESLSTVDARNHWNYSPLQYILGDSTTLVSGGLSDIGKDDSSYMVFRSYASATSSQSLFAHSESVLAGGAISNVYEPYSADGPALTLSASMGVAGRNLFGRFVYPLSGIKSIPSSTWTFYYRAWRSSISSSSQTSVLRPSGPGTYTEWTTVYPSTMPHWDAVNDVDADGDSSYVQTSTQNSRDTYALNNLPFSGIVSRVKVYVMAKRLSSGASFNVMIRTYGSDYFSGSFTPSTSYTYYSYMWDKNPYTGSEWTVDEVNSLEVGVQCAGTRGLRVTQIYVEVEWTSQSVDGHVDVDILIRRSDGSIRDVVATNVANSNSLTDTPQTLFGTYFWRDYQVVDPADYLEIIYYCDVTVENSNVVAYLRVDDDALAEAYQTRIANVMLPCEQTLEVEFEGSSNTYNWSKIVWFFDAAFTTANVSVTLQLYNYGAGQYSTSGEGYISYMSSSGANTEETQNQTIVNPQFFRDASGNWKIRVIAMKEINVPFDCKVDMLEFEPYVKGVLLTFKNSGSITVHIVSLWVINSTHHQRYDVDVFVNPAESLPFLFDDVFLPDDVWTVKVVTQRGNSAVFPVSQNTSFGA